MDRDTFLALASALEDLGRASAVARGGQRNSGQFYQTLAESGQRAEQRKLDQARADAEAKRQAILDSYRAKQEEREAAKFGIEKQQLEAQTAMESEEKDPSSQKSKMAQDLAKKLMPSRDFSNMSAYQLKTAMPTLEKMYSIEENNRARKENLQAQLAQRQDTKELTSSIRAQEQARKSEEQMDKRVNKYMDTLQKTGVPAAVSSVENVERLLPKTGDIPGYGRVSGMMPDLLVSQEGEDLRQAVSTLFNIELKDRSGAAVTDQELQRLRKEFGEGSWKSDDQLRKGITQYKSRLKEVIRNIEAGFDPDARTVYQERGGRNFSDALGKAEETKTIGGKIRVSNGKETLEIDPEDEQEAAKDGFRRVQ